jgi:hypothetical protein
MGINIGPKEFVKNNLDFFIDAANPASITSYNGNGTNWEDISPNRIVPGNGFLLYGNGIQYSNDFSGLVFFDNNIVGGVAAGPTGYAHSAVDPSLIAGTTITIEMFIKSYTTGSSEQNLIQLASRYYFVMDNLGTANPIAGFTTGFGDAFYLDYTNEGIDPFSDWIHMVIVAKGTGQYADYYQNKIYLNGVQATLLPQGGTYLTGGSGNLTFDGLFRMSWGFRQNGVIHGTPTAIGNRLAKFDLGVLRIYGVELTQEQISQNFESLRDRYGI